MDGTASRERVAGPAEFEPRLFEAVTCRANLGISERFLVRCLAWFVLHRLGWPNVRGVLFGAARALFSGGLCAGRAGAELEARRSASTAVGAISFSSE